MGKGLKAIFGHPEIRKEMIFLPTLYEPEITYIQTHNI